MLIIFGSFYLMKPSKEEIKKEQVRNHIDSLKKAGKIVTPAAAAKADTAKANVKLDSTQLKGAFGPALAGSERFITLENKYLR